MKEPQFLIKAVFDFTPMYARVTDGEHIVWQIKRSHATKLNQGEVNTLLDKLNLDWSKKLPPLTVVKVSGRPPQADKTVQITLSFKQSFVDASGGKESLKNRIHSLLK